MSEPKPFASLGATLLARKGGARPAMRPQQATAPQASHDFAQDLEDLGWNDMGDDAAEERRETVVLALTPAPHPHHDGEFESAEPAEPEVLRQQRTLADSLDYTDAGEDEVLDEDAVELAASFTVTPVPAPAPILAAAPEPVRQPARRPATADGRRAAFTLRLDIQRHLKLRLASTIKGRSAQTLVTQALDKFLAEIPEIDALAARLTRD